MNSPVNKQAFAEALATKLCRFEHAELGKVELEVVQAEGAMTIALCCQAVSMTIELFSPGEHLLRVINWHASTQSGEVKHAQVGVMLCFDLVFCLNPKVSTLVLDGELRYLLPQQLCNKFEVDRKVFYQWPGLWLSKSLSYPEPTRYTHSEGVRHPLRPEQPQGEIYRRYIPQLDKTLSFRVIDKKQDLDLFHDWMNQPKVALMWELNKSKRELADYLQQRAQDPHMYSVVGEFDGEAFGYFELYWTLEDRLGPYYDAKNYDRGVHLLVGNPNYLGASYFYIWFTGLLHYLFLEDPRTNYVMGEPRADNKVLLRHTETVTSFHLLKEFDFPHKRAALLECERQRFFAETILP